MKTFVFLNLEYFMYGTQLDRNSYHDLYFGF